MPKKTGIYQHKEHIERLLKEDRRIANKDTSYGEYLRALTDLTTYTDDIYEKGGQLTPETYDGLMERYFTLAEKCVQYREKGDNPERRNMVDFIHKLISRDVKALNSMDRNNPGSLEDALDESRTVRVYMPEELQHRVGGQMSDRFPMKDTDGKKGFFTGRTDAAHDKKWSAKIDELLRRFQLKSEYVEKISKLKTDVNLRMTYEDIMSVPDEHKHYAVAEKLGICTDFEQAEKLCSEDLQLCDALVELESIMDDLYTPLQMSDRLSYDPYTRNDNKNAAMYSVAKLLGCENIIAKAVPMVVVNGSNVIKGTFMEHGEGSDINNLGKDDPLHKVKPDTSFHNKQLYSDLADLQLLDYICGNVDRHKGNMLYKTTPAKNGEVNVTGITAIDNDSCFPEDKIKDYEFTWDYSYNRSPNIYKPENFRFVNEKTAKLVNSLTRGKLDLILRGHNISQTAIDLAWERTQEVQNVLKEKQKNNITYVSDMKEKWDHYKPVNSPFFGGDYKENPSIFTEFNKSISRYANITTSKNPYANNIPKAEKLDRKTALLIDIDKIARMNTRMERINRLKSPTKEFSEMRNAMASLAEYAQELRKSYLNKGSLSNTQFNDYKKRLDTFKEKTDTYIKEKGISPITGNGRERLSAARSFAAGAAELINNFESDKNLKKQEELTGFDISNDSIDYSIDDL